MVGCEDGSGGEVHAVEDGVVGPGSGGNLGAEAEHPDAGYASDTNGDGLMGVLGSRLCEPTTMEGAAALAGALAAKRARPQAAKTRRVFRH